MSDQTPPPEPVDPPEEWIHHLSHMADATTGSVMSLLDLLAEWADGGLIDPKTWTVVEAEPDTLAEMVRLIGPAIEFTTEVPAPGYWLSAEAGRVAVAWVISSDQAERFRAVLDQLREPPGPEDGEQ